MSLNAHDHGLMPNSTLAINPQFRQNKISCADRNNPEIQTFIMAILKISLNFANNLIAIFFLLIVSFELNLSCHLTFNLNFFKASKHIFLHIRNLEIFITASLNVGQLILINQIRNIKLCEHGLIRLRTAGDHPIMYAELLGRLKFPFLVDQQIKMCYICDRKFLMPLNLKIVQLE